MILYVVTSYEDTLRNVLYMIYNVLYKVHSTQNNDSLRSYTLRCHPTKCTLRNLQCTLRSKLYTE